MILLNSDQSSRGPHACPHLIIITIMLLLMAIILLFFIVILNNITIFDHNLFCLRNQCPSIRHKNIFIRSAYFFIVKITKDTFGYSSDSALPSGLNFLVISIPKYKNTLTQTQSFNIKEKRERFIRSTDQKIVPFLNTIGNITRSLLLRLLLTVIIIRLLQWSVCIISFYYCHHHHHHNLFPNIGKNILCSVISYYIRSPHHCCAAFPIIIWYDG